MDVSDAGSWLGTLSGLLVSPFAWAYAAVEGLFRTLPDAVGLPLVGGLEALAKNFFSKLFGAFVPAFFLAGAMGAWIDKGSVVKYLSPASPKKVAYPFATITGAMVSVCACGILPLFASIYARGAGIGPAITFAISGPAINLIACYYSFDLLGARIGGARVLGVVVLALAVGLAFERIYGDPPATGAEPDPGAPPALDLGADTVRSTWQTAFPLLCMLLMTLALPTHIEGRLKLAAVLVTLAGTVVSTRLWFTAAERADWMEKTWFLVRKIVPKVAVGIFITGCVEKLIPKSWIVGFVGENTLFANLVAAMVGGCMYFGTVTGIVTGKLFQNMGMADGPLLAFVIAGPIVSIPSALAISGIVGKERAAVFFSLVVLGATLVGWSFGRFCT